jgi:hypothetical protein
MSLSTNPTVATYSTRTMYVTPNEFLNAPTGVDTNNLVPGDLAKSKQALVMQLQRASAAVDNLCQKVIAATVDTESGFYRVGNHPALGPVLRVPLKYTPIIQVAAVKVGPTPAGLSTITDLSNIAYGPKVVTIPLVGATPSLTGWTGQQHAVVSYVNGWANTALTSTAATGATTLNVASALGIAPGMQLNVQSATAAETVTVDASFVPTVSGINVAVPITTPLVGAYAVGDTVTAFPQDIKEATILLAKAFIKTRGSAAVVLSSLSGQPGHADQLETGVASDLDLARMLLEPFKRVA